MSINQDKGGPKTGKTVTFHFYQVLIEGIDKKYTYEHYNYFKNMLYNINTDLLLFLKIILASTG